MCIFLILSESEWKLLLIRQRTLVGTLPGDIEVYKINKLSILPLCLEEPKDLDLEVSQCVLRYSQKLSYDTLVS